VSYLQWQTEEILRPEGFDIITTSS